MMGGVGINEIWMSENEHKLRYGWATTSNVWRGETCEAARAWKTRAGITMALTTSKAGSTRIALGTSSPVTRKHSTLSDGVSGSELPNVSSFSSSSLSNRRIKSSYRMYNRSNSWLSRTTSCLSMQLRYQITLQQAHKSSLRAAK